MLGEKKKNIPYNAPGGFVNVFPVNYLIFYMIYLNGINATLHLLKVPVFLHPAALLLFDRTLCCASVTAGILNLKQKPLKKKRHPNPSSLYFAIIVRSICIKSTGFNLQQRDDELLG